MHAMREREREIHAPLTFIELIHPRATVHPTRAGSVYLAIPDDACATVPYRGYVLPLLPHCRRPLVPMTGGSTSTSARPSKSSVRADSL